MSTNTITKSATPSAWASEDWELEERPQFLTIELRRSTHAFPWMRLAYAEGDDSEVKLVFGTHFITVKGHGLDTLLSAITAQQLSRIRQPMQSEAQFGRRGSDGHVYTGPGVDTITVTPFK